MQGHYNIFDLGDLPLQSGAILKNARLAYKTYGTLDSARSNAVILPTFFTGTHTRNEGCFGPDRAIDPARHFIVSINLFGNGLSTSPSNAACGQKASRFPRVTIFDNIKAQHRLLTEELSVESIALVSGWSMAGIQAYHWATQYPDMVRAILPYCASAKCSPHNFAFLDGPKAALQADADWRDGNYNAPPVKGLKAFGRVYVAWGYSQAFFRDGLYRDLGFETMEDLVRDWEEDHLKWDANDLLAKIWTWQNADISNNAVYLGDVDKALASIRARAIVMPISTDLYFPPGDNAREVQQMQLAELRTFESPWGHCGGSPGRLAAFTRAFDKAAAELLES